MKIKLGLAFVFLISLLSIVSNAAEITEHKKSTETSEKSKSGEEMCKAAFHEFITEANNIYWPELKNHINHPITVGKSYFNAGGVKQVAQLLKKAECHENISVTQNSSAKSFQQPCKAVCKNHIGKLLDDKDTNIVYFTAQHQRDQDKSTKYMIFNLYPIPH